MNSSSRCPQCNGPLAETTGQPMCPACLMRGAIQPTDSELARESLSETQSVAGPGKWDSMQSIGASEKIPDLQPGSRFGEYRIIGRLGRGGMGVVYEAEHTPTSRRIALKVLAQSLDQPEAKARFMREGRLAASINHPNSVYVYGTEEIDGIPTISMELVSGGTLAQYVKANGPLPVRQAVDAVLQIIDGLAAADRRGVLHRDVKPSNCFVASDGTVKVGDFGLSISTSGGHMQSVTDITTEGTFLGTPAFASPEQLRGEPLDRRSDIYAVGVTLFYLLTGTVPFDADNMIHLLATVLDKPAPSTTSVRSDIPADLDAIITKCLQKPAGNRFDRYESLRTALKPFSSEAPIPATLGNRTLAGIVDTLLCWSVLTVINILVQFQSEGGVLLGTTLSLQSIIAGIVMSIAAMAYYALSEWRYGYTPGKRLFGMRVCSGDDHPSLRQTFGRALLFVTVPTIPSILFNLASLSRDPMDYAFSLHTLVSMFVGWLYLLLKFGLFVTARAGNGYLAIHDRITGTRVLERSADTANQAEQSDSDAFEIDPEASKFGPYHQLQTLFDHGTEKLILGYDAKLLRRVWLHLQPIGTKGVDDAIKDSTDDTTLRWLGGRRSETECWDCYESPGGKAIAEVGQTASGARSIRILRRLVQVLISKRTGDGSGIGGTIHAPLADRGISRPTLQYLWTTDLDRLKVLPFKAPLAADFRSNDSDDNQSGDSHSQDRDPAVDSSVHLLRQVSRSFVGPSGSKLPENQSWSLGECEAVDNISHAESLADAQRILAEVHGGHPVKLRSRIIGMIAVSLAIPLMTVLIGILALVLFHRQRQASPEIEELHEVVQVIHREETKLTADRRDRLISAEHYLVGNFREVIQDKNRMSSLYAIVKLSPADRSTIKNAIERPEPTEEELRKANESYPTLKQEWIEDPVERPTIKFSFWTSLGPAYTWLEFVWFPSLVTGLLFRGGILIRLFGLVFVNRHGQRASGLRVFIRMIFSGIPVIGIVILATVLATTYSPWNASEWVQNSVVTILLGSVAATMLAVPYIRGNQCFSDRFAGTYLVAK